MGEGEEGERLIEALRLSVPLLLWDHGKVFVPTCWLLAFRIWEGIALGQLPGQVTDSLIRRGVSGPQRAEPGWSLEVDARKQWAPAAQQAHADHSAYTSSLSTHNHLWDWDYCVSQFTAEKTGSER